MMSQNSINILLILSCLLLRFSIGHSLLASVKKSAFVGTAVKLQVEGRSVKAEEAIHIRNQYPIFMQQGVAVDTEERTRFGRKMETGRRSKAMRSQHCIAEASSTTSGKVRCIETCDSNGRPGCVKRKFSKRRNRRSMRINMSGFVSWSADYNVPRPHPPRNN